MPGQSQLEAEIRRLCDGVAKASEKQRQLDAKVGAFEQAIKSLGSGNTSGMTLAPICSVYSPFGTGSGMPVNVTLIDSLYGLSTLTFNGFTQYIGTTTVPNISSYANLVACATNTRTMNTVTITYKWQCFGSAPYSALFVNLNICAPVAQYYCVANNTGSLSQVGTANTTDQVPPAGTAFSLVFPFTGTNPLLDGGNLYTSGATFTVHD